MLNFRTGIKSVQRGILTMDADPDTVTITAVVLAKSFLIITSSPNSAVTQIVRGRLTNTTTITLDTISGSATAKVDWQVVEYY